MSEDNIWTREHLDAYLSPGEGRRQRNIVSRASIVQIACFALAGMAVTAVLAGKDVPQTTTTAYFDNGETLTAGRHSLDLARPIFIRGNVPICQSEDELANYSSGDARGCTTLSSDTRARLVGIVTDGMRQPTFQMQMNTPDGPVRGWVGYNNLTN